jgi:hypothetical protein
MKAYQIIPSSGNSNKFIPAQSIPFRSTLTLSFHRYDSWQGQGIFLFVTIPGGPPSLLYNGYQEFLGSKGAIA